MNDRLKVAIIGSGNIGTDLMMKVMRLSRTLEMGAFAGIDPYNKRIDRNSDDNVMAVSVVK